MWKDSVLEQLAKHLQTKLDLLSVSSVGGGSINDCFRFSTTAGDFFIKKNSASRYPQMFQKEKQGLELLSSAKAIATPEIILQFEGENEAFLILRYIESVERIPDFWDDFAVSLGQLHRNTTPFFGLDHDNYIGSLSQSNSKHDSWVDFYREERLDPLVRKARDKGQFGREVSNSFERFYVRMEDIFPVEAPSLIHGDLWAGNFMVNDDGRPMIIDPAVYYGFREMDLAMSKLFGGFDRQFYQSYDNHFKLEKAWEERIDYCNLYPLLVHILLFGGGYVESVRRIIQKF